MPARTPPDAVRYLVVAALAAGGTLLWTGIWPAWAGCPLLFILFGGAWWIVQREAADEQAAADARQPTPEQVAARRAESEASSAAWALEVVEHERVEAVLRALLAREDVAFRYSSPKGGHMDKREGTYRIAAPLPVGVDDVAALNGPLTRFTFATAPDGRTVLTALEARDRHGGGLDVFADPA